MYKSYLIRLDFINSQSFNSQPRSHKHKSKLNSPCGNDFHSYYNIYIILVLGVKFFNFGSHTTPPLKSAIRWIKGVDSWNNNNKS